jgi:hypothetical protein
MLAARRQKAIVAIREMGTNCLPTLLSLLAVNQEPSSARREIEYLLSQQSFIKLHFPEIPDRRSQATEAFRILGAVAEPAIPKLAELLESGTGYGSAECLQAIGPEAVPILVRAMHNPNPNVVWTSMQILGEFGSRSQHAVPELAEFGAGTNAHLAWEALEILSEIEPNPTRFLSLFEAKLNDTNLAPAAAFALGRIGPAGVPALIRGIAQGDKLVRIAASAALSREVKETRRERYPTNYSFRGVVCLFNSRMLTCSWLLYNHNQDESCVAVPAATECSTIRIPSCACSSWTCFPPTGLLAHQVLLMGYATWTPVFAKEPIRYLKPWAWKPIEEL